MCNLCVFMGMHMHLIMYGGQRIIGGVSSFLSLCQTLFKKLDSRCLSVLDGLAGMVYVITGKGLSMLLNITWHVSSFIPNAYSKIEAIPVV